MSPVRCRDIQCHFCHQFDYRMSGMPTRHIQYEWLVSVSAVSCWWIFVVSSFAFLHVVCPRAILDNAWI